MIIKSIIVGLSLMSLVGCSDGFFTSPTTNDLMQPIHAYELDTWGSNSEIYEFNLKSTDKTCVMFMLDSGAAMGLQCFDKEGETNNG